jgi:hypothetical protein
VEQPQIFVSRELRALKRFHALAMRSRCCIQVGSRYAIYLCWSGRCQIPFGIFVNIFYTGFFARIRFTVNIVTISIGRKRNRIAQQTKNQKNSSTSTRLKLKGPAQTSAYRALLDKCEYYRAQQGTRAPGIPIRNSSPAHPHGPLHRSSKPPAPTRRRVA